MRFFLLTLVCLLAGPAMAQDAPITLTYQGSLADAGGQVISGVRAITFRMYEQAEGGDALWTEVHGETDVIEGTFSAVLGLRSAFGVAVMGADRLYLGVQIGDEVETTPRMRVGGALKAQWAAVAAHAKDVRGEDINPASVTIGGTPVIDGDGRWVGDPSGLRGPAGLEGPPGPRGPQGIEGAPGSQGPRGPQGLEGPAGPRGVAGEPGPQGAMGSAGPAGPAGSLGEPGAEGPAGATGPAGPAGPAGADGERGASLDFLTDSDGDGFPDWIEVSLGSDPLDLASEPIDLNEDGVPDALVGAVGPAGPVGERGERGERGEVGPEGPAGALGPAGPPGPVGEMPLTNLFDERPQTPGEGVDIPRAIGAGVDIPLVLDYSGVITSITVSVDVTHPDINRLRLTLIAPDATPYVLFNGANEPSSVDLRATFPGDRDPVDSLQPIVDRETSAAGRWVLRAVDTDDADNGAVRRVNSWGLNITRRADDAWRLPTNLVVDGAVDAQTLCRIEQLIQDGEPVPGAITLTCGNQDPVRLTTFQCGNGRIDPAETCDDGNFAAGDGCDPRCLTECGNGRLDENEACDDGNQAPNDNCTDECEEARCGDNIIRVGVEDCDDGNDIDTDSCTNACTDARCGDGIVGPGEECDGSGGCQDDCSLDPMIRRVEVDGSRIQVTLAGSNTQSCADACQERGMACHQIGLQLMAGYVGDSNVRYEELVEDILGIQFNNGAGSPDVRATPNQNNYFGIGCGNNTWQFNGFLEPMSGCNDNTYRTARLAQPTCDNSGYTDGNFSGPRICACR